MTLQAVASVLGPPIAVKMRDDGALIMTGGGKQKVVVFQRESPDAPFLTQKGTR